MTTTTPVKFPTDLLYSRDRMWVRIREGIATVGIAPDFNDEDEIEFIDLPDIGGVCEGDELGAVETLKASIAYTSPVTGTIIEVNDHVELNTDTINRDRYGEGWLFRVKLTSNATDGLLNADEYREHIENNDHVQYV